MGIQFGQVLGAGDGFKVLHLDGQELPLAAIAHFAHLHRFQRADPVPVLAHVFFIAIGIPQRQAEQPLEGERFFEFFFQAEGEFAAPWGVVLGVDGDHAQRGQQEQEVRPLGCALK